MGPHKKAPDGIHRRGLCLREPDFCGMLAYNAIECRLNVVYVIV